MSALATFLRGDRVRTEDQGLASVERIVERCRELMKSGILRPRIDEIATGIVTPMAVQRHFETVMQLYRRAIDDEATRTSVLRRLMPNGPWPASDDCDRILEAVIGGRMPS